MANRQEDIKKKLEKTNPGVEFTSVPIAKVGNFYTYTTDDKEVVIVEDDSEKDKKKK